MKKTLFPLFILACSLAMFPHFGLAQVADNSPVTIPDANLRAAIAQSLGKPSEAQLTVGDMLNLTLLDGQDANIQDLTGLEPARNLVNLYLQRNSVTDISALSGLTQLRELYLGRNNVADISPLAGMTQLRYLSLSGNSISDVSALSGMKQLIELSLGGNNLTDISALSGLTELESLYLERNRISDVSALSGLKQLIELSLGGGDFTDVSVLSELTRLRSLSLANNNLTDLSAISGLTQLNSLSLANNNLTDLSAISGLTQLTRLYLPGNSIADIRALESLAQLKYVDLGENPLNYTAINAHIPAMQAKGVEIQFYRRAPRKLVPMSAATQHGVVKTALPLPFVVEVRDQRDRAFASVPVTFRVTAGDGQLGAASAATDPDGRAQAYLTLGSAAGETTVSVTATGVSQPIEFTATAIPASAPVTIPDVNLRRKITETLGKQDSAELTPVDMFALTALDASDAGIRELTGLEYAHNLGVLNLARNTLSDVSPLGSLTRLTELNLSANPLNYTAINADIPAMRATGVEIAFDHRAPTTMVKISGEAQRGSVGTALPLPYVVEARDQRDRPFAGVPVTFRVTAGGGQLGAADTATDLNGRARARLTLGGTVGTITVGVTAAGMSQAVQFTATAINPQVSVPDGNLRAKIAERLGKPRDAQLTVADMLALTQLDAPDADIQDLTGLEHARNMRFLTLGNNVIGDASPLSGLTQLTWLDLGNNSIRDASPLAGLTQMQTLDLSRNAIGDMSPLSELTQLTRLDFSYNGISDVSPLSALTKLTSLSLGGNDLGDVTPLAGLTQLTWLDLGNNSISDVSPLAGLTQMTTLAININELVDVSPLSSLTQLTFLSLTTNPLSYASINAHIPAMQAKGILVNFYLRTPMTLLQVSSAAPQGLVNATLPLPFVVEALDQDNNPFAGVPVTFRITSGGGQLSPTNTSTDLNGRAQAYLTLGPTPGAATVSVTAAGVAQPIKFTATAIPASAPVTIPDVNLRRKITETLGKQGSAELTMGDMFALTTLDASEAGIQELTGLEHARNMRVLTLGLNSIGDASPLSGLTQLTRLDLSHNVIGDMSPLSALTKLTFLNINGNSIRDASPIAGLTQLTSLGLSDNYLGDVSPLSGLTKLTSLSLGGNVIGDVTPLAGLTQLTSLSLAVNPLSYASINAHIPAMQAMGIRVDFDLRTPTTLLQVSAAAPQGLVNAALPLPFVVEALDQDNNPFAGVPVTFRITAGDGQLGATSAATDRDGRAQAYLTLGSAAGKTTISVTAAGVSQPIEFTATAIPASTPVTIPDSNLRRKIAETLGKQGSAELTTGDMFALTTLDASDAGIQKLTGLEHARNMRVLTLGINNIGDASPLSGLTKLTSLSLGGNGLGDVTPLAELTQLTRLELGNNSIRDVSPLAGLTQLTSLGLSYTGISDVSPLSKLTQLTWLELSYTGISDVSSLSALTKLTFLNINGNSIRDASPLAGLTQLASLGLSDNYLGDVSPLAGLTKLTSLNISGNLLNDMSALSGLTQMQILNLSHNAIGDMSPISELTQLTWLELGNNSISDVSPLAGLTKLTFLNISGNSIRDASPLAGLTQLTRLDLGNNSIRDVSPLAGLTQMTSLAININELVDVSPLSGMTRLEHLSLGNNRIRDVSPLSALTQLPSLSLTVNPLSYASINAHIPAMQAMGIRVNFDLRTPTTLLQVSAAAPQGLVSTTLPLPFVVEALDQDNNPFAGVPVAFRITSGGGQLGPTNAETDLNGRAQAYLTLGPTPGAATVSATAPGVSQAAQFTATALLATSPVSIPDANLRAKIAETLGKAPGGTITVSDMLTLTTFNANGAGIYDLAGLQFAGNLTTLSLEDNKITEIAPLAGLTRLTTLSLNNNSVWNLEPITGLTLLTTLSLDYNSLSSLESLVTLPRLQTLHLRGNWLDGSAFDIHIPAMQAKGTDVRFDTHPEYARPVVRLIYFLPSDRRPQLDIDEKLDGFIKSARAFYAEQMEVHGFGRKTFQFAMNNRGKAKVHFVKGKFEARYYFDDTSRTVNAEVAKQFDLSRNIDDLSQNINFIAVDNELVDKACGTASPHLVHVAAAGECFTGDFGIEVTAHELGHAFGLQHDFRNDAYLMSYGSKRTRLSYCAAEWLNAHRAFNPARVTNNTEATRIEMLPPSLAAPTNAVRLRFVVTNADGLHQAQLLTPTLAGFAEGSPELLDYKALNGSANATVEFVTTDLTPENKSVSLQAIDVNGYHSWSGTIPIDISSLTAVEEPPPIAEDANGDGVVNIQDLVMVSSNLGLTGKHGADVNGDGVVNIQDLVAVAAALGEAAAAPAIFHEQTAGELTASEVKQWIAQAQGANLTDPRSRRGIRFLQHLLAMLTTPQETKLLANYPNPFNPETWIPYQLAKPAEVALTIYAIDGSVVRDLALGHQPPGIYQAKSRAAYWDGRNAHGEGVASGIYFYTLSAGDFSATRKMLIRK